MSNLVNTLYFKVVCHLVCSTIAYLNLYINLIKLPRDVHRSVALYFQYFLCIAHLCIFCLWTEMSLKDIDGQKNRKEWKDIGDLKWTSHQVFNISL